MKHSVNERISYNTVIVWFIKYETCQLSEIAVEKTKLSLLNMKNSQYLSADHLDQVCQLAFPTADWPNTPNQCDQQ